MATLTPTERPIPVTDFRDPTTRTLLANDGTTTVLLEAVLRAVIRVEVGEQFIAEVGDLEPDLRIGLELPAATAVLVRSSVLRTAEHTPVSANRAIIVADPGNPVLSMCSDRHRPLGMTLLSALVAHRRRVLSTGHYEWLLDGSARTAAGKRYLIIIGERPAAHLTEIYSPDLFSARLQCAVR